MKTRARGHAIYRCLGTPDILGVKRKVNNHFNLFIIILILKISLNIFEFLTYRPFFKFCINKRDLMLKKKIHMCRINMKLDINKLLIFFYTSC